MGYALDMYLLTKEGLEQTLESLTRHSNLHWSLYGDIKEIKYRLNLLKIGYEAGKEGNKLKS